MSPNLIPAADLARVPLPSLNVYRDRLLGAVAHGDGDRDQAALALEQGALAVWNSPSRVPQFRAIARFST